MADVTLTIALPDIEAHTCNGRRQPRSRAIRTRLPTLAQPLDGQLAYSPQVEANMVDLMGDAARRVLRGARWMRASMFSLGWDRDDGVDGC